MSHYATEQNLIPFAFSARQIRTWLDRNGAPWFCAADICAAIGVKNHRDCIDRLEEDERCDVVISDATGRFQPQNFISEPGMYTIVLRSHEALEPGTDAYRFRKWVTAEVLPTLRKQGYFGVTTPTDYLKCAKSAAQLVKQMVSSRDQMEQYYLWEMLIDLSRTMGIQAPDVTRLGKTPQALPGAKA